MGDRVLHEGVLAEQAYEIQRQIEAGVDGLVPIAQKVDMVQAKALDEAALLELGDDLFPVQMLQPCHLSGPRPFRRPRLRRWT